MHIYILYRVLAKIMVHPNDKARTLALALAAASRSRENFKFLARPGLCIISGIRYFDKLPDNLLNLPPRSTRTHTNTLHAHVILYILSIFDRVSAFACKDAMSACVCGSLYIYIYDYYIWAADSRTCVCIGPDTGARKVHDGFWRAAKICGPSDLLCVPTPAPHTHPRTLQQQQSVYSHISACEAILCCIRSHTHILYIEEIRLSVELFLSESVEGGCIYIRTHVWWWKRRVSVCIALSRPSLFLFFARRVLRMFAGCEKCF